ncbi:LysR family transcriptional regulator [Psychrobacillus soli]|uniref:LysR family transcriptional regulator n=1 Tax=Psychrobacillus soli TaxID=1543965 RepID=A0A544TKC6_9BACI|nr:LysR family transcriptional regulator [Psychrobacillus soli]TQR17878.1 LysR family transcriptional regulator [Psychrobacillus soli]
MKIDHLKYIVEIADTGSISDAAESLQITQPTISQSITSLEKDYNIKIFTRSRQGTTPTESGKLIIQQARDILRKVDELKDMISVQNYQLNGSLTIGAIPSFCLNILPKSLNIFKNQYPDVQIKVFEDGTLFINQLILEEKVNIGLVSMRYNEDLDPRLSFKPLFTSKTIAYVGQYSPLAKRRTVSLKEIIQYPLVLFNEGYSTNFFMKSLLEPFGKINIVFTSGSSESMKKVISESFAVGFYGDVSVQSDPYVLSNQIVPIYIEENFDAYSVHGIVTKKSIPLTLASKKFIDELQIQTSNFIRVHNLPDYSKTT